LLVFGATGTALVARSRALLRVRTANDSNSSEKRGKAEASQHFRQIRAFHTDSPPFQWIEHNS